MAIKVLITRRFNKAKIINVLDMLRQMRAGALNQPGYISGETLYGRDDPKKLVVIATWDSEEDWRTWQSNETRRDMEGELDEFLLEPARYEVFGNCSRFLDSNK